MAIFHLSCKVFSRRKGSSALAAAAYRAAEKYKDERRDLVHDYTRKQGVLFSEIHARKDAPRELVGSPEKLWNAAEKAERRWDATVAREFEVSLPWEMTDQERAALVRGLAKEL